MSLYRRKLWGDRTTLIVVLLATVGVIYLYFSRGGQLRLYILTGWGLFVAWLIAFSELRIGRKQLRRGRDAMFLGLAAFVGEETVQPDGTRKRGWTGAAPGALAFEATGIRWVPKLKTEGPQEVHFDWADVYSWRLIGVVPFVWRASGYLAISLYGGREQVFHIHGIRSWRHAVKEAAIVGPTLLAPPPQQAAAQPQLPELPQDADQEEVRAPGAEGGARPWGGSGGRSVAPPTEGPTLQGDAPGSDTAAEPTAQTEVVQSTQAATPADLPQALEAVIGLECHVELSTNSKMFCGCPTIFGTEANTQVCPVCTGQPGSLPVPNRVAIEHTIRIALALGAEIAPDSLFHRKNYFYPDMPKNYQISQYDIPLASGGNLEFEVDGELTSCRVHRVHLEEDTGKTTHAGEGGRIGSAEYALVDYNRAGIPLVEIVSEADLRTPEQARAYVAELRTLLLTLGVSDVRMEEGSLRCDANISMRPVGQEEFGTKTEIKNMNSLRSVQRALAYEIERQTEVIGSGGSIVQETRHFDEATGRTIGGRSKEYSADYRYFPDPDLIPLSPPLSLLDDIRSSLPELPLRRRQRFTDALGIAQADARTLVASPGLAAAFEASVAAYDGKATDIARWYIGELSQLANEKGTEPHEVGVSPEAVAALQRLVDDGTVSISVAKGEVLRKVAETGKAPADVVAEAGLVQISDTGELDTFIDEAIAENANLVEQYRGGKLGSINALVGSVMKKTRGQANAQVVKELLEQKLS